MRRHLRGDVRRRAPTATTSRPARAATSASAVPQAPAPITRDRIETMHRVIASKSRAGVGESGRRVGVGVEQPARAGRGVHRVGQAERQPFGAGPGDHRAVVGAQRRRRHDQRGLRLGGDVLQRAADRLVGGDAAGGDQRARRAELFVKQPQADAQPVGGRFQHRGLKAGAEIADVLRLQRRQPAGLVAHRGLQSRQREIGVRRARASAAERRTARRRRSPPRARPAGRPDRAAPSIFATLSKASPMASSTVVPSRT